MVDGKGAEGVNKSVGAPEGGAEAGHRYLSRGPATNP